MQARGRPPRRQVQFLYLRSGEGARRHGAATPADASLHRRWRIHGLRQDHQPSLAVPAADALVKARRFTAFGSKSSVARALLPSSAGLHGRTTTRTDQAPFRDHAVGDAVHVRDELATQSHGVILAVSLLFRRSLRADRRRRQRDATDDSKSCDQSQTSTCSAVSHRRALSISTYIYDSALSNSGLATEGCGGRHTLKSRSHPGRILKNAFAATVVHNGTIDTVTTI